MKGRIQLPVYPSAALDAANPSLLEGEIACESDTGRRKIGDGVSAWRSLPYMTDAETVPALAWKVQDGMLCVRPATDPRNPILGRCFVGILHYKNARRRYRRDPTGTKSGRPQNAGFKLVQDKFAGVELAWTPIRINPVPFDTTQTDAAGWMPLIATGQLIDRWVEKIPDSLCSGDTDFRLHRGNNVGDRQGAVDALGKRKMQVSFYGGVVLFTGDAKTRVEGPRSYFRCVKRNFDATCSIIHV